MNHRFISLTVLALALSWTVLAQNQLPMREGNWEVTAKLSMPGMEMPPMKQTQCLTAAMLKDPMASIPKGPGGGDCKLNDYKLSAASASYTVTCTKPTAMTMIGEVKYSGTDAYSGTMTMDASGQKMSMVFDAKRLGDCAKQ